MDDLAKNAVTKALFDRKQNPKGKNLDRQKPPRENFVVIKTSVDRKIAALCGRKLNERVEFTQEQLDLAESRLSELVEEAVLEALNG